MHGDYPLTARGLWDGRFFILATGVNDDTDLAMHYRISEGKGFEPSDTTRGPLLTAGSLFASPDPKSGAFDHSANPPQRSLALIQASPASTGDYFLGTDRPLRALLRAHGFVTTLWIFGYNPKKMWKTMPYKDFPTCRRYRNRGTLRPQASLCRKGNLLNRS